MLQASAYFGLTPCCSRRWARPSRSLKAIDRTASIHLGGNGIAPFALVQNLLPLPRRFRSRAACHHVRVNAGRLSKALSGRAGCAPRPTRQGNRRYFACSQASGLKVAVGSSPADNLPGAKALPEMIRRYGEPDAFVRSAGSSRSRAGEKRADLPLRPAGRSCQRNLETRSACSRMTRALSSVSVPVGSPL